MVDEGVLDRRRGKEPRTLSGRTCYAAIARLDNLDIQTAWVMMRFGFRHVTAVTSILGDVPLETIAKAVGLSAISLSNSSRSRPTPKPHGAS
jgi:hypothetical protein